MNEVRYSRDAITAFGMIVLNIIFRTIIKYADIVTVLSYFSCNALWMSTVHGVYKPIIQEAEKKKDG